MGAIERTVYLNDPFDPDASRESFSPSLVRELIETHTTMGQIIFDPFCGSGTACAIAARLGRIGIGWEISKCTYDIAIKAMDSEAYQIHLVDSLNYKRHRIPPADLIITSPPFSWIRRRRSEGHIEFPKFLDALEGIYECSSPQCLLCIETAPPTAQDGQVQACEWESALEMKFSLIERIHQESKQMLDDRLRFSIFSKV